MKHPSPFILLIAEDADPVESWLEQGAQSATPTNIPSHVKERTAYSTRPILPQAYHTHQSLSPALQTMSAAQDEFNELMRDKSRRTAHPEDDDDAQSFLNLSDEDDDDQYSNPPSPTQEAATPRASTSIPTRRYAANTGPKGVISDAQNFRDSRRSARTSTASTRPAQQSSRSTSRHNVPENTLDEDDEEGDDDGPADQGFMARWRQSRIREMQSGPKDSKMHLNGRSKNAYGGMATVDG